jgi:RHS repeat-associated protein
MDNVTSVQDWRRGVAAFKYDEIGRLLSAQRDGHTPEFYGYDANGTILETHRGVRITTTGGRTLQDGARAFTHDVNGAVNKIETDAGDVILSTDVDGRLVRVQTPDGVVTEYGYDALGRRVTKTSSGVTTRYLWEGCVLAGEITDGAFTNQYYLHALQPLAQWNRGRRETPITDLSGAVREVLNDNGALAWECILGSYGEVLQSRGENASPFRFRGQYFDTETGFHFNFFRTYDPLLGDYLSTDPLGIEGGTQYYAYPRNPLVWDDPFGLKCGKDAAHKAEDKMDKHFQGKGYRKISIKGKDLNANGIDAIYHNPKGDPKYIIAEAKSGSGSLRYSGDPRVQQMSDGWINGKPGNASQNRLEAALPPQRNSKPPPAMLPNEHLAAIQGASASDETVGKRAYHPDKDPPVYKSGFYDGRDSTTDMF